MTPHIRGCPLFTHPTQRQRGQGIECTCPGPTPGTQTARLIAFLRTHPEATSLDVTLACGIVNVTGRVSDARAAGVEIVCSRRFDGRLGYRIVDPRPVMAGEQIGAFGA